MADMRCRACKVKGADAPAVEILRVGASDDDAYPLCTSHGSAFRNEFSALFETAKGKPRKKSA